MGSKARFGSILALIASVALLAETSPPGSTMYLRISHLKAAPMVASLNYDAVATVPARPFTPAALLPRDRVLGSIVIGAGAAGTRVDPSSLRSASSFTVVQCNDDGIVVERTTFTGISIRSIAEVGLGDGNMGHRIEFDAASVVVSVPKANVALR